VSFNAVCAAVVLRPIRELDFEEDCWTVVDDHLPAGGPLDPDAIAARAAGAGGDGDAVRRGLGLLNPADGDPDGVREPAAIARARCVAGDVDLLRAMVINHWPE